MGCFPAPTADVGLAVVGFRGFRSAGRSRICWQLLRTSTTSEPPLLSLVPAKQGTLLGLAICIRAGLKSTSRFLPDSLLFGGKHLGSDQGFIRESSWDRPRYAGMPRRYCQSKHMVD